MVPAFREIVEACFEENLLGVVFATETLALGVNMPARSVVLERFTKYSDAGRQTLTSGEYAQLTGRAGRRGLDDEGHAIVSFANETSLVDVARVAAAPPGDLHSSFRPTYNFTANLINHVDQETALRIVHQSFAQFEATHRPSGGRRSLEEQLLARARVLNDLGYATGWQLTEQGQLLRSLYHECDLLVAETLAQGVLTDLEPSQLAGILSCFVYEGRRAAAKKGAHAVTTKKRRVVNDRLGQERRDSLRERFQEIVTLHAGIMTVEESHHIRHQREPDMSFATIMTAWARGATLGTVLDLADIELGLTAPGDFVRNAKQVADLCEQVGRLSQVASVANNALAARDLVLRSVVAGAAGIPHDGQAPS
jgi:superfamily II RNA helicase